MQQYTSAFHFLSAAVNLRPTRGHIFMLLAISLTYLDDEENARQAYEQAVTLEARDPSVCLNFAIFLYNHEDKDGALKMINEFEIRMVKFRQSTGADLDSEVIENGAKLAALLGVDGSVFRKKNGRNRLQAQDDTAQIEEPQVSPPLSKQEPEDPSVKTESPNMEVNLDEDDNISELPDAEEEDKGELIASAHLEFQEDREPKKEEEEDQDDESNEDNAENIFN
ncbi:hypothetical protein Pcinc_022384 [Petrolisthes cinctipes]|uniref:Uncharacterized protein n=1 Tax=Petrolisthes cinctipes TaxID=88211 RepID=A0AAE1FFK7_PETCI|nr:hypothetical protein Pcinc_022384 [Petrolisthes cinctipes]